jgi:hypothetical protein
VASQDAVAGPGWPNRCLQYPFVAEGSGGSQGQVTPARRHLNERGQPEQILRHVIGRIRRNWPAVEIIVRGDSQFATPEVMDLSGGLNAGRSLREG